MKQEHNEADGGGHGFPVGVFVSRQARQGVRGFSGVGAAMTQSRSDSGVYTGLICWGLMLSRTKTHVRREKSSENRLMDNGVH